jgi:two-component system phosphate regulon sensor histidine kinase PhoR
VPAGDAERVFERLWQAEGGDAGPSRKGLGLGLHICRELVARQGGRIWVDPVPGQGATFCFTLPLQQAASAAAAAGAGPA